MKNTKSKTKLKKNNNKMMWIAIISAILLIVAGYFIYTNYYKDDSCSNNVCATPKIEYKQGTYFGFDEISKYTAVIYVDNSGKVKSVFIDAVYAAGCKTRNTLDNTCTVTTKQILGDNYGMKAASAIKKEWYEQANTFAKKVIKEQSLSFVKWTNAEKTTTDSISGVTMSVDGMYKAVDMALTKAIK